MPALRCPICKGEFEEFAFKKEQDGIRYYLICPKGCQNEMQKSEGDALQFKFPDPEHPFNKAERGEQ